MTPADRLSGIAAVVEVIDCGGARHRLEWEAGALAAPDHPDPHGERVLAGLGATRPHCLQVLDAWAAHDDDLRVLTLGPRHPGDQVSCAAVAVEGVRHGNFARHLQNQRIQQQSMPPGVAGARPEGLPSSEEQGELLRRHLELLTLFTLPASLQRRLMVTVAAAHLGPPGEASPAMVAALIGRAGAALRSWAGEELDVDVRLGSAAMVTTLGGRVSGELPADWLVAVWGAGLAVVEGHFVCEVLESTPEACTVRAMSAGSGEVVLKLCRTTPSGPWGLTASRR